MKNNCHVDVKLSEDLLRKLLYISEHTVKDHTKKIYPKMGVHSRFELAVLVSRYRGEEK